VFVDGAAESRAFLEDFLAELRREFPNFRVIDKRHSPLSRAIDLALRAITLGGQREYLTRYYTVLGDRLYVPPAWDHVDPIDAVITLRHERVHLRQRRRYTFVGMAVLYLFVPLPLGLSWGRARIEKEAYEETLRATLELRGEEAARSPALRARIVAQFVGPAYGWMWPFRGAVERWYDDALERIARQHASSDRRSPAG
jgi:hypothetical protein